MTTLDGDEIASEAEAGRGELVEYVQRNYDDRDVFGVPLLILPSGERFWGWDRMDWALRHGFVPTVEASGAALARGGPT